MSEVAAQTHSGWQAHLNLQFRKVDARTVLSRRRHSGPLRVQRPFYPEGGVCHVYLLHPPGGVVGGDELRTELLVGTDAAALVTTPAATKVYRSAGADSVISQRLRVGAGASLECLPQGTLLFGGSRLRQRTVVELAHDAAFCAWDITSLGRPHSGDDYASGRCEQSLDIHIDGQPILVERQVWRAGDAVMTAPWGFQGRRTVGSLYAYPADADTLARARKALPVANDADASIAATLVDGVLVVRALADDAVRLQQAMAGIWSGIRPLVVGRPASQPRIWAT